MTTCSDHAAIIEAIICDNDHWCGICPPVSGVPGRQWPGILSVSQTLHNCFPPHQPVVIIRWLHNMKILATWRCSGRLYRPSYQVSALRLKNVVMIPKHFETNWNPTNGSWFTGFTYLRKYVGETYGVPVADPLPFAEVPPEPAPDSYGQPLADPASEYENAEQAPESYGVPQADPINTLKELSSGYGVPIDDSVIYNDLPLQALDAYGVPLDYMTSTRYSPWHSWSHLCSGGVWSSCFWLPL